MTPSRKTSSQNRRKVQGRTSSSQNLHVVDRITRPKRSQRPLDNSSPPVLAAVAEVVDAIVPAVTSAAMSTSESAATPVSQNQQQEQGTPSRVSKAYSCYEKRFGDVSDGYVEHKEIGLVMHPSFYDDQSRNFTLCSNIRTCPHEDDCYEMRKRMAVFACIRGLSYREAAFLWHVSKSTLQREVSETGNRISLKFLVTPKKE